MKAKTLKKKLEFESSPEISKTIYVVDDKFKKKLSKLAMIPEKDIKFVEVNKPSIELIEKLEYDDAMFYALKTGDFWYVLLEHFNKINEILTKFNQVLEKLEEFNLHLKHHENDDE